MEEVTGAGGLLSYPTSIKESLKVRNPEDFGAFANVSVFPRNMLNGQSRCHGNRRSHRSHFGCQKIGTLPRKQWLRLAKLL